MKLQGNYNFGVYNPPSGLDAVRYSEQASTELALNLNNLQTGQETGFIQNVTTEWPSFVDADIDLLIYLNNIDASIFEEMVQQGWGGNISSTTFSNNQRGYPPNPIMPINNYSDYDIQAPIKFPDIFFLQEIID